MYSNLLKKLILLSVILFTFGLNASARIGTIDINDGGRFAQDEDRIVTVNIDSKLENETILINLYNLRGNIVNKISLNAGKTLKAKLDVARGEYKLHLVNVNTLESEIHYIKIN